MRLFICVYRNSMFALMQAVNFFHSTFFNFKMSKYIEFDSESFFLGILSCIALLSNYK